MRYFLAALFIFAVGAPTSQALPTLGGKSVALSKTDSIDQVAKRGKSQPTRSSRSGTGSGKSSSGSAGGIHPLVGSGEY